MTIEIVKTLSANDVGDTGGHQAGILVPKQQSVLEFFPKLDATIKNPRTTLAVNEIPAGSRWKFNFIYYNSKLLGSGTRNEYRLTGMTAFLRSLNARAGDELRFARDENGSYTVRHLRSGNTDSNSDANPTCNSASVEVLTLSTGWRVIKR